MTDALTADAERRAAYRLVEAELREFGPMVDLRIRRSGVTVEVVEWSSGRTLIDAVDALRERVVR